MEEEIAALFRRQHGVLTAAQALGHGLSRRQIEYRVSRGDWIRLTRGVYRHAAVPVSWRGNLLADCFALNAVASHRSAAFLHGIDGYRPSQRELVVAHGRKRPTPEVILHESTQMDRLDCVMIDAIPCTGLARTVLDLGAVVGFKGLLDSVDAVVRDRQLSWIELYDVMVRHARRGRDGCGRLRAILDERFGSEAVPLSAWSRMVADLLVGASLPKPELEYRIETPGGRFVAQVDLAYPADRVAIELDSIRWHLNRDSFVNDPRRKNELTVLGWTVLTFTWSDYVDQPRQLCATVAALLS